MQGDKNGKQILGVFLRWQIPRNRKYKGHAQQGDQVMEKLIEELEAYCKEHDHLDACNCHVVYTVGLVDLIRRAKSRLNATERVAEDLAVLADRKGKTSRIMVLHANDNWDKFESESKARAFLESLPDSHPGAGDKGGYEQE